MQNVFVIITKLIASNNYFCKEVFCNNFGRDGMYPRVCVCVFEGLGRFDDFGSFPDNPIHP